MIYKSIFNLTGTVQQQQIVQKALDKIHYPWHTLTPRFSYFEIGWADLNDGTWRGLKHVGRHPEDFDKIEGMLNGRKYTLGIFYPYTGHSYIDKALVNYPAIAETTVSAELAHLVDFFLPLTDEQKRRLVALMHGDEPHDHDANEWWEKVDYGAEYYGLPGEGFMQAFTLAYSDMDFDGSDFSHTITKEQAPVVRQILGIERTDGVTDAPAPAPVEQPEPEPVKQYMHFRGSKVYHTLEHYTREDEDSSIITDTAGLRPCKICKP